MAVQSYISVDWDVSPRIVTVADTETAVTIQDLYDTLRTLESASNGVDNDSIVSGAGKEVLGPGLAVGLTIALLDAKLAFEARPPSTYVQCAVRGGNLTALDTAGDPVPPIKPTAYTQVVVEQASGSTAVETIAALTEQDKLDIADRVLDELIAEHQITGSVGAALASIATIWDRLLSGMVTVGSIGKKLADWALGSDGKVLVSEDAHTSGQTVADMTDKTGMAIGVGGIPSTAFAAGAIDDAALDASAGQTVADEMLGRDLVGGASSTSRNVRNALRALRNKTVITEDTLTIMEEDDQTPAWAASVTRTADTQPVSEVDPT